jgi:nucleoside 2-deoxyribosyltransferase
MANAVETLYLIGSLRSPEIRTLGNKIRTLGGFDVVEDWHAAGSNADTEWQEYEQQRGRTYLEAIRGLHAKHVFEFDLKHITRATIGVLMLPAGKSAHMELGYMLGQRKRGYVLFDKEPERYDVMYQFATGLFMKEEDLFAELKSPGQYIKEYYK